MISKKRERKKNFQHGIQSIVYVIFSAYSFQNTPNKSDKRQKTPENFQTSCITQTWIQFLQILYAYELSLCVCSLIFKLSVKSVSHSRCNGYMYINFHKIDSHHLFEAFLSTASFFTNEIFDDINSGISFIIPFSCLNSNLICLSKMKQLLLLLYQSEMIHTKY